MTDRKLFFVLIDHSGSQVLTFPREGTRSLPIYENEVSGKTRFEDPGPFNSWFVKRYDIKVIRRCFFDHKETNSTFFILESIDEEVSIPRSASWVGLDGIDAIHFEHPEHKRLLASWFTHPQQSVTMPWSELRGYEKSLAWACDQLTQRGRTLSGTPEQVRNTYVSTVLRCPTDAGDVYLKILPSVFIREIQVLEVLTGWGILELPRYLAIDPERRLLLMEDMGGCDLADCCTTALLKRTVREFADFQVASTLRITPERHWPFYDWRMGVLKEETEHVAQNAQELLAGSSFELNESEIDLLRNSMPNWLYLCNRIIETDIPDALDHGDLRLGNIRIVGERIIFYDWAWSAIAHPFMSITSLLHILRKTVAESEETRQALRDAYLEAWTAYAPLDELRQIFDLVDRAKVLYGVVADGTWLKCLNAALAGSPSSPTSADAWTVRRRQYYYAKMVRRLLESVN